MLKKYISIFSAVIFLTASSGIYIIEHYCDACGTEDAAVSLSHSGQYHDHGIPHCNASCDVKHHHQNHEKCDVKFFKVDEPYYINHQEQEFENSPIALLTNEFLHLAPYHLQSIQNLPSLEIAEQKAFPVIYKHCQLLI